MGTPDVAHTQLVSCTACRRSLTLPEPWVLAAALCSAALGTVQCQSTAWHTARGPHRSLLQVFPFTWTGLALTHASPSVRDGSLLFPPTSRAPLLTGTHLASRCRTLTTRTRSSTRLAPATGERPESNMAAEIAACLRTQGRHVAATGNAAREDRLVLGQPELRETMAYTAAMTIAVRQSCAV